jgi:L-lactate dehydrogenase
MSQVRYGKLVIIGAGNVGSAILNSVLRLNMMEDIVVINRNREKALGEVLDASHTLAFAYSVNTTIRVGGYEECADAHIIVNTAGPSIQPGRSRDRMVLLHNNIKVMKEIMQEITKYTKEAIIINVSNPVDILTYIAQKKFDYPADKILSTGTLLDTARFNKMLGDICRVDSKNVTGFVLGEHGNTSFVPWHTVNIVGIPFEEFEHQFKLPAPIDKEKLLQDMKVSGLDIVELKGYTSSGIALSVCRLIGCIIRNERAVLPVSIVLNGQYGLSEVAMSLPCVVSKQGIEQVLEIPLDEGGYKDLMICYDYLHTIIESVKDELE